MSEISAVHFEAVKISLTQSADGIILKLAVHPDDCPPSLMSDYLGSRYMTAMAKLNSQEEIDETYQEDVPRLIASCGALCRNEKFQTWLLLDTGCEISESNAVEVLRSRLGIGSRSEFNTNPTARAHFVDLREDFQRWLKSKTI